MFIDDELMQRGDRYQATTRGYAPNQRTSGGRTSTRTRTGSRRTVGGADVSESSSPRYNRSDRGESIPRDQWDDARANRDSDRSNRSRVGLPPIEGGRNDPNRNDVTRTDKPSRLEEPREVDYFDPDVKQAGLFGDNTLLLSALAIGILGSFAYYYFKIKKK